MIKSIVTYLAILVFTLACNVSKNAVNIEPASGNLVIPSHGELRVWNNINHAGFDVVVTNPNEKQSCEMYAVKSNGTEKWINPSLLAKSSLTITIPSDGHLYIKNFNPNDLTIRYKIKE